jgi:hypothetical protein
VLETCPRCHTNLTGDRGHSRVLGIEVWGVYDGVLYWQCPDCEWSWPRDFEIESRLRQSIAAADEANARLAETEPTP